MTEFIFMSRLNKLGMVARFKVNFPGHWWTHTVVFRGDTQQIGQYSARHLCMSGCFCSSIFQGTLAWR